ncbi:MAG: hypothetical protein P0119_18780 [Nitrospira sp.]|nr:hypothetical protein [Nitrospira sp.]
MPKPVEQLHVYAADRDYFAYKLVLLEEWHKSVVKAKSSQHLNA